MRKSLRAAVGAAVMMIGLCGGASAHGFRPLYTFCTAQDCSDGNDPRTGLVADPSGNVYGTTRSGGANGEGTVFELVRTGAKKWEHKVLYSFCSGDCLDGDQVFGGLVIDVNGALYGTTYQGGPLGHGSVYRLTPKSGGRTWTFDVLYGFCTKGPCVDGNAPMAGLTYAGAQAGLPYDGKSPLYGTTLLGGADVGEEGGGTVFELVPVRKNKWRERVIWAFCRKGEDCPDGQAPDSPLVMDAAGNLYGTNHGVSPGVLFELSPAGDTWIETTLHTFCSLENCADGSSPTGGLFSDGTYLYGTAAQDGGKGSGTMFKLQPAGTNSPYTVLHDFCSRTACKDGATPLAGLVSDNAGSLYGTTSAGGANGHGTLFKFGTAGLDVLHSFCAQSNCEDGSDPAYANVMLDNSGDIFGTTLEGGTKSEGTVFELSP